MNNTDNNIIKSTKLILFAQIVGLTNIKKPYQVTTY